MQLVLDTNGLILKKRNNSFWIISKKHRKIISPHRISSIAVIRDCLLSTAAIRLAIKHQIPIFFFNYAGKAEGSLWSPYFGSIATIRRNQLQLTETAKATQLIVKWFQLKMKRQEVLLEKLLPKVKEEERREIQKSIKTLSKQSVKLNTFQDISIQKCRMQLLGTEGYAAKIYWQSLSSLLPLSWQFKGRSRRPAQDPFNAILNYLYGMLYNLVEQATLASGLDPMGGFLHVDDYLKTTFVFDSIEPFRPWVEELLIDNIFKNPNQQQLFSSSKGYQLNKVGRQYYIPLFNDFFQESIHVDGRKLSRKNHIFYFLGSFAQTLKKEKG